MQPAQVYCNGPQASCPAQVRPLYPHSRNPVTRRQLLFCTIALNKTLGRVLTGAACLAGTVNVRTVLAATHAGEALEGNIVPQLVALSKVVAELGRKVTQSQGNAAGGSPVLDGDTASIMVRRMDELSRKVDAVSGLSEKMDRIERLLHRVLPPPGAGRASPPAGESPTSDDDTDYGSE